MSTVSALHTVIAGYGLVHPAGDTKVLNSPPFLHDFGEDEYRMAIAALADHFPRQALRRLPLYVRVGLLAAVKALQAAVLRHS